MSLKTPTPEPVFAISIRQPWAWLIVNGPAHSATPKDIENRDWPTNRRGPVFVHASLYRDEADWESAIAFAYGIDPKLAESIPDFDKIERGGIVGRVNIADCVPTSNSPWFVGDFGFVLEDAKPVPFVACPGALKFFIPSEKVRRTLTVC